MGSGVLLIILFTGLTMGLMVAQTADSASEATITIDHETGEIRLGGEAVGDPITTDDGTPVTQLQKQPSQMEDAPGNVIDWSYNRAVANTLRSTLTLVTLIATATAQFLVLSPIPVDVWTAIVRNGTIFGSVLYAALRVRDLRRQMRHEM